MHSENELQSVVTLVNQSQFSAAFEQLKLILNCSPSNIKALKLKVKLGFTSKNLEIAQEGLKQLSHYEPSNFQYIGILENIYLKKKDWTNICQIYAKFVQNNASHAVAQYNYAYYLKLTGQFKQSIEHYNCALNLNISDAFEIYLNIAIIYNEHLNETDKAIKLLLSAQAKYPNKDAIVYNLANIYEQIGDKKNAMKYFELAHRLNPKNYNALARLADIQKIATKDDPLIDLMLSGYSKPSSDADSQINLAYALGKAHNDCLEYDVAFKYYQRANHLDAKTLPAYNRQKIEYKIDTIISTFDRDWFNKCKANINLESTHNTSSLHSPTFICGMFRSGSTLCEQILASHPLVQAGGEQEYFHRTVKTKCPNFPNGVLNLLQNSAHSIQEQYINEIYHSLDPNIAVTDKRPDNFLYIGFIKTLFPSAKIIWTKRQLLDNCLSVYFLRLGASMNYATDLTHIIHFYQQQERLMNHWVKLFPNDISVFDYDKLIHSPKESIESLLESFNLPYDESCMSFHRLRNNVKTASVWQVRQPLYKGSSNRWLNYRQQLEGLGIKQSDINSELVTH